MLCNVWRQVIRNENRLTTLEDQVTGEPKAEVEIAAGSFESFNTSAFADDNYRSCLYAAIDTLPDEQRRIIEMIRQGISIDSKEPDVLTIRKVLGKSEKTIRTYRDKAYAALRTAKRRSNMTPMGSQPSREDVLYAFAVEPISGRESLEHYLRDYPEYAAELIDLSYELSRDVHDDETPLSAEDEALIDRAWRQHVKASPQEKIDPFAALSVAVQRELAQQLDVPRQVITAFREHRVEPTSVPLSFLGRLAAALNSTVEILIYALGLPPEPGLGRSYKADSKPCAHAQVNFEQILIEADMPSDKRTLLMKDESQDG
jgi:hypothetical protein